MTFRQPESSLVLIFVLVYVIAVFVIWEPRLIEPKKVVTSVVRPENNFLQSEFKESHEFDELVVIIKNDIEQETHQEIHVTVVVGPYFRRNRLIAFLDWFDRRPYYYIGLDEEFLKELTTREKHAVVAHELGHILYPYPTTHPSRAQITEAEVRADNFATKYTQYTNHKDMLSSLEKAHADYFIRKRHLEELGQKQGK